jgi:hypothetical protein
LPKRDCSSVGAGHLFTDDALTAGGGLVAIDNDPLIGGAVMERHLPAGVATTVALMARPAAPVWSIFGSTPWRNPPCCGR